ncbi:hypothetical protein Lepto7375DRAFT_7409 [Leptolyngbya sp. PCC 7375]|nr:hypothetical protein Lepto7375DRAFT_7409 [Leptolyngbya sp. PCC 7375]
MKIKLVSDYRDYYDHWFEGAHSQCDRSYVRLAKGWMSKFGQFVKLDDAGWTTPLISKACRFPDWVDRDALVVVYIDDFCHRGEGKIVMTLGEAISTYPEKDCSAFIRTTDDPLRHAISRRLLCIGDRLFWLTYESKGGWRSNYGPTAEVTNVGETLCKPAYLAEAGPGEHDFSFLNQFPLWAVDFVEPANKTRLMAIDLNTAPGLRGTGIEDLIKPKEVFTEITRWFAFRRVNVAPEYEEARTQ